ncbi:uncharacterized protein [Panulirus ornatus]|uniref:uncharacterized protein n=1 Tax=Panulirus ornatus TaxID=150431 RepID=UPI003A86DE87
MAPNSAFFGFTGTPAFLARVKAIPAFNDALNLATQVYDTTKNNEVMGAAIRAAEASMRVAAMGALPLATPIVERVGGWEAVDKWACRGLDRVERAAPIIKSPTKEIVSKTRRRVLGAVAGDQVIVPPTLTQALIARANRVVDTLTDNVGTRAAGRMVQGALDTAQGLMDTYLPAGRGDRKSIDVRDAGVTERIVALGQTAGHRVYRTTLRTMRPDLAYFPGAVITPDMVVQFGRSTVMRWYAEVTREPQPGERPGLFLALVRWPARLTLATTLRLMALLAALPVSGAPELIASAARRLATRVRSLVSEASARLASATRALLRSAGVEASDPFTAAAMVLRSATGAKVVRDARDLLTDYGLYVLEEARLWGKALAVLIKLSPNIARKVSDSTRLLAAAWLRDLIQLLGVRGSATTPLYKKGFVPVKVTMMAPREAF